MLFALPTKGCLNDNGVSTQEVANAFRPPRETPIDKLRSQFETSSISRNEDSFSFFGVKRVGRLFEFDKVERPNVLDYPVTFDYTYIVALDLGFLDISFINPVGDEVIASETVYVYPYDAGNGHKDIVFALNDERFKASYFSPEPLVFKDEYVGEVAKISAHSIVSQAIYTESVSGISFSYGDTGGSRDYIETTTTGHMDENTGGIVYPTIAIAQILSSFDNAVGFAEKHFPAPGFFPDPVVFFGYQIKMNTIKENYRKNASLSIPIPNSPWINTSYINSQNLLNQDKRGYNSDVEDGDEYAWAEWSFGFKNMKETGCPVFALYNLLVGLGYTPSLPVLIAFFELCNADLLMAVCGGCALREETINVIRGWVHYAIVPAIALASAGLMCIPYVGPFLGFLGLSTAVLADAVVEWLIFNQRGLGDVLDYLGLFHLEENILLNPNTNLFGNFKTAMKPSGDGIICYFNDVDKNTLEINYFKFGHFAYIHSYENENTQLMNYVAYNVCPDGNGSTVMCADYNSGWMMHSSWTNEQAERALMAYYVLY